MSVSNFTFTFYVDKGKYLNSLRIKFIVFFILKVGSAWTRSIKPKSQSETINLNPKNFKVILNLTRSKKNNIGQEFGLLPLDILWGSMSVGIKIKRKSVSQIIDLLCNLELNICKKGSWSSRSCILAEH